MSATNRITDEMLARWQKDAELSLEIARPETASYRQAERILVLIEALRVTRQSHPPASGAQ